MVFVALAIAAPALLAPAPEADPAALLVDVEIRAVRFEDPPPTTPFGPLVRNFRSELLLLRQIANDPTLAGVRLHLEGKLDHARSLDVLRELQGLQAAGKKIVCYAETLDKHDLRICALADYLAVPPSGLIVLQAPYVEAFYLRDLLAKFDAEMEVLHVGEFKTAYEDLARDTMSAAQRETLECLLAEFYGETVRAIAEGRGLEPAAVEELFGQVMVPPAVALEAGLIDAVSYEDEFDSAVRDLFGGEVCWQEGYGEPEQPDLDDLMSNPFTMMQKLTELLDPSEPELPPGPRVAVVYATGAIVSGESKIGFDGTIANMGSDTIVEALEATLADEDVKAVVLRVNSPGGSATASDMIWRAIQRVRARKPVVASMGWVAGSGGYWISMGCDRIVAQPSTITGSIGVVSALPNLSGALKKAGVNVEVVAHGPRAEDLTLLESGPSPFLKARVTAWMEAVYDEFLAKAAAGRGLDRATLEPLAHGRVWTGRQALEHGLVDALGDFEDALVLACELGGGLDPETTPVVEYPRARDFAEMLEELFEVGVASRTGLEAFLVRTPLPAEAAAALRTLVAGDEWLHVDRVQALVPFCVRFH